MAKVLFFNSPLYGHVLPTLPVVEELVARGEQVIYYLTEEFRQDICRAGASMQCYRSTIEQNRPSGRFSQLLARECQYVLPQVIERVRDERPEYVLYEEICLWGRILAEALGVPAISCRASLAVNEHFSHMPHLMNQQASPVVFRLLVETLEDFAPLAEMCMAYGLPLPRNDIDTLFFHAERLNIVFASRLLQPAGETFDKRFVFVGAPTATREQAVVAPVDEWMQGLAVPLLYVSLGTIYHEQVDFYRLCVQALGDQPWKVVLVTGKNVEQSMLGPVPDTVLVCSRVAQCAVLQRANVFITHGGLNSLMEALYYGVPMVIVPQMPEQVITARRLVERGVAVMLERTTLSPQVLREACSMLLHDEEVHIRLRALQEEVQSAGGAKRAVDAIERFLQST